MLYVNPNSIKYRPTSDEWSETRRRRLGPSVTIYKPLVSRRLGRVASVKSPAFVNTPRYSEVSLADARGFFLSLLERFFHVKSVSAGCDFVFVLCYLLVPIVTPSLVLY